MLMTSYKIFETMWKLVYFLCWLLLKTINRSDAVLVFYK